LEEANREDREIKRDKTKVMRNRVTSKARIKLMVQVICLAHRQAPR
jgi:hypothetical protein